MQFHHQIYSLIKTRYFSLRLFASSVGQKTFFHFRHIVHIYFSRLAKELLVILPIALFVVLVGNLLQPQSQFEIAKENVLLSPTDSQVHAFLAQELMTTNQFAQAKTEANLSDNLELQSKIQMVQLQPERIQEEILFWQTVVEKFPNYRDAYIQLAVFNWRLYRQFDSKKYLEKALAIDPNNEIAKNFQQSTLNNH